jgi:hypothetical protein
MGAWTTPREWIISHRCSWIAVYVFCRNAHSESHSDPHDICMLALLDPGPFFLHYYYHLPFTCFIYILANY